MYAYDPSDRTSKNQSADRVLVLKVMDGKKPESSTGLVDSRLFTGENKLHAVLDDQYMQWYLKYEMGGLPEPLKQRFTSFAQLMKYARSYFHSRNIEIVEVIS